MNNAPDEKTQGRDEVFEMVPVSLIDNLRLARRAVSRTSYIDGSDADIDALARAAFELTNAVDERKAKRDEVFNRSKAAEGCAQAAIDFIGQFRHDVGLRADGVIRHGAKTSGWTLAVDNAFSKVFPHDELRSRFYGGLKMSGSLEIKIAVSRVAGMDGGSLESSGQFVLRNAIFRSKDFEQCP